MSEQDQRCFWRNSATLIIAGQWQRAVHGDYGVLMLERSRKSAAYPGVYVFPGGTISDVDFAYEWGALFDKILSVTIDNVTRDLHVPGPRPPIMSAEAGIMVGQQKLDPSIAYRICAIRETFEESGILLATRKINDRNILTDSSSVFTGENLGEDFEVWREKVQEDPWSFLAMCKELRLVPDVWALREWNNWLTQVTKQVKGPSRKPYRFNTMFYICCLDHTPKAVPDSKEIIDARWLMPQQAAGQMLQGKFRGTSGYELLRVGNFSLINELFSYIRQREPLGIEVVHPVQLGCNDGFVTIMPGDGLYPNNPDIYGTKKLPYRDKSVEELREETSKLHRSEHMLDGTTRFICNIKLSCGQVAPADREVSHL